MVTAGVVRLFHDDEGWGVIDAPGLPGGCWVHFSAIAVGADDPGVAGDAGSAGGAGDAGSAGGAGLRRLEAGQAVWVRAEAAEQDGFQFRAVKVWRGPVEPDESLPPGPSGGYRSELRLD